MATGGALACEAANPSTPDDPQPLTTPRLMAAIIELTRGLGIAQTRPGGKSHTSLIWPTCHDPFCPYATVA